MLDSRWSQYVRDYGKCEADSIGEALTWSHIISRTYIKVRWDVRNTQCLGAITHAKYEGQPLAFSKFVQDSSCGQYSDVMTIQANSMIKPNYDVWFAIYDYAIEHQLSLPELRELLGQQTILTEADLIAVGI